MKCEIIYLWEWEMVEKGTRLFERRENRWMECDACALGGFRWCFYRVHHANIHKDPNSYFSFFGIAFAFALHFHFHFATTIFESFSIKISNLMLSRKPFVVLFSIPNMERQIVDYTIQCTNSQIRIQVADFSF